MSSSDQAFIKAYSRDLTPEGVLLPEAPQKVRVMNPKNMAAGAAAVHTHYDSQSVSYRHDHATPAQPPTPHTGFAADYSQTPAQYGAYYQPAAPYPAAPAAPSQPGASYAPQQPAPQQPAPQPAAYSPNVAHPAMHLPPQPAPQVPQPEAAQPQVPQVEAPQPQAPVQQHVIQPEATPSPAPQPEPIAPAATAPTPVQPTSESDQPSPAAADCYPNCDTPVEVTSDDMAKPASPRDDIYTVNAIASVNTWAIELASEIDTLYIPAHSDTPGQLDLVDHTAGIACQNPVTQEQEIAVEEIACEESGEECSEESCEVDNTEYQLAADPEEILAEETPAADAADSFVEPVVEAEVGSEVYALRTNDDAHLADVLKQSLREAIQEGVAAAILHAPAPQAATPHVEEATQPEAFAEEEPVASTAAEEPVVEEAPAAEAVTEETVTEEVVAEEAVAEEPAIEEAIEEEAVAEEPVVEEPVVEEPVAEETVVEEAASQEEDSYEFELGTDETAADTDVEETVSQAPVDEEPACEEAACDEEDVAADEAADVLKMPVETRELQPVWEVDVFQWPEVCCELIDIESPTLSAAAHQIMETAGGNVLAIASVDRGVGRTTMAMTLARALAAGGGKVLLIDADVENPGIGEALGLSSPCCWRQTLAEGEPAEECSIASLADRITLMPLAEEAAPADSVDFEPLLREVAAVADNYTAVIIDGGPVDALLDGMLAGPHANLVQATLLMNDGRSSDEDEDAASTLEDTGMKAVAMVENFAA